MSVQIETFASNTGQFTNYQIPGSSGAGALTITGTEGQITSPFGGFGRGNSLWQQNQFTPITSASCLVTATTDQDPLIIASGTYLNYACGIMKDGNNFVCLECHIPPTNTTELSFDILAFISGVQHNLSGQLITSASPDGFGFGLNGNQVTAWFSIGGVWASLPAITLDFSPYYDFTQPGALTGWNAFFGCFNDQPIPSPPGYLSFTQLRLTQPFTNPTNLVTVPDLTGLSQSVADALLALNDLSTGTVSTSTSNTVPPGDVITQNPLAGAVVNFGSPVDYTLSIGSQLISVYGKFAPVSVFVPTLLIDAKGIKPRIYMPKDNVTVKT